jgi:hypothetical protein
LPRSKKPPAALTHGPGGIYAKHLKLRDRAVHPAGRFSASLLHPELQVNVEWRFLQFRYQNAAAIVEA